MGGKLFLIPTTLGDSHLDRVIPPYVKNIINSINYYIVENIRTARRYLRKLEITTSIDDLTFFVLNKHTDPRNLHTFLEPITKGEDIGLLSEAGVPGVADPGADITKIAHKKDIRIIPLVGPSSILLALMASGMNGQNFSFVGYLPIEKSERIKKIKQLENRSFKENQTQIFIETPYRNQKLLNDILQNCQSQTQLCIAADITLNNEFIKTLSIANWRKNIPDLNKKPCIFLIHQNSI